MESAKRLLLFDDNIRSVGGHFLELASLLINGAHTLGYETELAAHHSFRDLESLDSSIKLTPAFRARRTLHWSLGVDGLSLVRRDCDGRPVAGPWSARLWHALRDPVSRADRRPQSMIRRWAEDFLRLESQWQIGPSDVLLINTADDFSMLALATALKQMPASEPLTVHVIFHFAVYEGSRVTERARQFGRQVNEALAASLPHRVHLHATTESLASQLTQVGVQVNAIPYPTRRRVLLERTEGSDRPLKMLLAGMPRAEKGRGQMKAMLSHIQQTHLDQGNYRVSMQMPDRRWKRMIPAGLRARYQQAASGNTDAVNPFEVLSAGLSASTYHQWLDTADVGMFLYEPVRYEARCSGVLLEMLIRGVPVIVPDRCWLADQVNAAGGNGSIGYIYGSIDDLPALLNRLRSDYVEIRARSIAHAQTIAARHEGANTLREMGLSDLTQSCRQAAA